VVIESLEPLLAAGGWVPEMVRRAGGWELLGREGEPSATTSWEQVREVEPQVLVLALRDADAAGAEAALESATLPPWFDELLAVRDGEFFAVDGRGLFVRPGPRVVEGIAVLAELCFPEVFAGAGPVGAWRPLAPIGIADPSAPDEPAGRP
jgi:iron complex transport system substrate-binding protein